MAFPWSDVVVPPGSVVHVPSAQADPPKSVKSGKTVPRNRSASFHGQGQVNMLKLKWHKLERCHPEIFWRPTHQKFQSARDQRNDGRIFTSPPKWSCAFYWHSFSFVLRLSFPRCSVLLWQVIMPLKYPVARKPFNFHRFFCLVPLVILYLEDRQKCFFFSGKEGRVTRMTRNQWKCIWIKAQFQLRRKRNPLTIFCRNAHRHATPKVETCLKRRLS